MQKTISSRGYPPLRAKCAFRCVPSLLPAGCFILQVGFAACIVAHLEVVIVCFQPSAIELPASQGGRQSLPPVNRNMTSSLAEADAAARAGAGAGRSKAGLDSTLHGLHKANGEGIMEAS
jgi:hypothetical protein